MYFSIRGTCKNNQILIVHIQMGLMKNLNFGYFFLYLQILVRDCIAGLLVNLSVQDFKDVEGSKYVLAFGLKCNICKLHIYTLYIIMHELFTKYQTNTI